MLLLLLLLAAACCCCCLLLLLLLLAAAAAAACCCCLLLLLLLLLVLLLLLLLLLLRSYLHPCVNNLFTVLCFLFPVCYFTSNSCSATDFSASGVQNIDACCLTQGGRSYEDQFSTCVPCDSTGKI